MKRHQRIAAGLLALFALLAAACSSSSSSPTTTTGSGGSGSSHVFTLGVLTDLTGPAASGNKTSPMGVQAGVALAKSEGYTVKYVVADTGTNPTQALSAAQQLVQQDHVDAVVSVSSLTFSAAPWLTQQGVPVVGVAEDGPEWMTSTNMFSVFGPLDTTKVTTTPGSFFKLEGATNVGSLGYSVSPASSESAQAVGISVTEAGLKAGYVNGAFPFGGTNVQPVAIRDEVGRHRRLCFRDRPQHLVRAAHRPQAGGGQREGRRPPDRLRRGPRAGGPQRDPGGPGRLLPLDLRAGRDAHRGNPAVPADALEGRGHPRPDVRGVRGLHVRGALPRRPEGGRRRPDVQPAGQRVLAGLKAFNAAGLLGSHTLDMGQRTGIVNGPGNCFYMTKASGGSFLLVQGADPICGTVIPGKTVSAAH